MEKLIFLKDRDSSLEVIGRGVFKNQISEERYKSLMASHPDLADKFEVIIIPDEPTKVTKVKEIKE